MERVNGETDNDHNTEDKQEWGNETERENDGEKEHTGDLSPLLFYPSPSQNVDSDITEIEASCCLSSDKQAVSHMPAHTLDVDTADSESVEESSLVPGSERQEKEDTQQEETFSRPTFLPTVCTHTFFFVVFLVALLVSSYMLGFSGTVWYSAFDEYSFYLNFFIHFIVLQSGTELYLIGMYDINRQ